MRRRRVLVGMGMIAAGAGLLPQKARGEANLPIQKPRRLQPGDTVGIVSPAGATYNPDQFDLVVDAVKGLGFVPQIAPHALERYGYLAGRDEDRAADINAMFADPEVVGILPIRGDWGSARILPYLNYDLIRANPKVLIGFSDITALLLGIHARTGLITFHGPHGITAWRLDQVDPLRRIIMEGETLTYTNPLLGEDQDRLMRVRGRVRTITPGQITGRLIGGNLSVLAGLVGSPYMPNTQGAILFLEDVGEAPYRVDRMITQLKLAGVLDGLAGFIFGQCSYCTPGETYGSLTLEEILQDHIKPLGIPAWSGAWIGHVEPLWTLPIGGLVRIDAEEGSIRMMEVVVR
jgi:muramoyltetrapeptide carboxypeptidase